MGQRSARLPLNQSARRPPIRHCARQRGGHGDCPSCGCPFLSCPCFAVRRAVLPIVPRGRAEAWPLLPRSMPRKGEDLPPPFVDLRGRTGFLAPLVLVVVVGALVQAGPFLGFAWRVGQGPIPQPVANPPVRPDPTPSRPLNGGQGAARAERRARM